MPELWDWYNYRRAKISKYFTAVFSATKSIRTLYRSFLSGTFFGWFYPFWVWCWYLRGWFFQHPTKQYSLSRLEVYLPLWQNLRFLKLWKMQLHTLLLNSRWFWLDLESSCQIDNLIFRFVFFGGCQLDYRHFCRGFILTSLLLIVQFYNRFAKSSFW